MYSSGTTHAPKQLERWLQQLPVVQEGKLTFHVLWLPPNASWLDQMEIWFSILQRMRLQPNHFQSLQELKQAITDFIAYSNQEAKPIKWTYTVEKLEKKLEQRIKQEKEQKLEQKDNQNREVKLKQKNEHVSEDKLKQKIAQKLKKSLKEKKSQNGEIKADQNSDRISA